MMMVTRLGHWSRHAEMARHSNEQSQLEETYKLLTLLHFRQMHNELRVAKYMHMQFIQLSCYSHFP